MQFSRFSRFLLPLSHRPPPATTTTWAFRRATRGWAGGGKCPCGLKYVVLRLKLTAIKRRNLPLWPKRGVVFFPNQRYTGLRSVAGFRQKLERANGSFIRFRRLSSLKPGLYNGYVTRRRGLSPRSFSWWTIAYWAWATSTRPCAVERGARSRQRRDDSDARLE